jgi:hypothetical protein
MTLRRSRMTVAAAALLLTSMGAAPLWAGTGTDQANSPSSAPSPEAAKAREAARAAAEEMRQARQQERQRNNIYTAGTPA